MIGSIIVSLAAGFLVAEFYLWGPRLSNFLLELAVRRLPEEEQDRFREEWSAYLGAMPNGAVRLIAAVGLFSSAGATTKELAETPTSQHGSLASRVQRRVIAKTLIFTVNVLGIAVHYFVERKTQKMTKEDKDDQSP